MIYVFLALPQTLILIAFIVKQRAVVVGERRIKLGVLFHLITTAQHGAHNGSHLLIPAVITHDPPAAVTMHLQFTRAAVHTSSQSEASHLCRDTDVTRSKTTGAKWPKTSPNNASKSAGDKPLLRIMTLIFFLTYDIHN